MLTNVDRSQARSFFGPTRRIITSLLQKEEAENIIEHAPWQKQVIEERLSDYYQNSGDVADFDKTIDDIEKGL